MSKIVPAVAAVVLAAAAAVPLYLAHAADPAKAADTSSKSAAPTADNSKVGYSFGYMMGKGNKEAISDLDTDSFVKGFKEAYAGKTPSMTEDQMRSTLMAYKAQYDKKQMEKQSKALATNEAEGKKFLAENAKKPNIKTTASGLQYEVLKEGTGKSPVATDEVKVNYEGKLLDGKVFDSSIARNEPATFPLNNVIPGWTEGVQLMKEGAKYRFFIPAALAYGTAGAGGSIPPNSTLIFEVELLKVGK